MNENTQKLLIDVVEQPGGEAVMLYYSDDSSREMSMSEFMKTAELPTARERLEALGARFD